MFNSIKQIASLHKVNASGWRTKRHIIVMESDDWGAIRMPSNETYRKSIDFGIEVHKCPYNRYDKIESKCDLEALFSVLEAIRDSKNRPLVMTANFIMANPDFDRISQSNYEQYHYKSFVETLNEYYPNEDVFAVWQKGIIKGLIYPQFHGREHVYVDRWLSSLRNGLQETRFAFDHGYYGVSTTITKEIRKSYLAALDMDDISELEAQREKLKDGLRLFREIFGFNSQSFIAPNYTWNTAIEEILYEEGVRFLQNGRVQHEPLGNGKMKTLKVKLGTIKQSKLISLLRNVLFEPALNPNKDWVNYVIKQAEIAFFWNKPVVISTHRLNYIGGLDETNQSQNLAMLQKIFKILSGKYNDLEFMTSVELGQLIKQKH